MGQPLGNPYHEIDMRSVRFNAPKAGNQHMHIITINVTEGMLRQMDALVTSDEIVPSRSELIRQFIREGLDRQQRREERRRKLAGAPP